MTEPYRWRLRALSVGAWLLGITTGIFPVVIVLRSYPDLPHSLVLLIYGLSAIFLTVAWRLLFERPSELDKQIPISSKELRRRKKTFYDWLNSQGRH